MVQDQPSAYLTWPTTFQPIPDSLPPTIPPPVNERTFRAPFGIDADLYNFALKPQLPLTFAAAYVVTVFALNAYNRSRNHEPWRISKTAAFGYFVVVHNVVLALYSFATFAAMASAIAHTWPGLNNPNGAAGIADALCKLHGPRGLGDAATFNTTINIWETKNSNIRLLPSGVPDASDVGRLWNEGLAFWGWIFYVSKFYEVIDTLIILAKGKRSATLQTYHHAGAMLCMWAGIRYMSPPIWMFVFINSGIHAMMYTYFTASALGVKVPQGLKRTLTSLQIAQFVFGASYAAAHLFVAYDIPIQTPYQVVSAVERVVSTASSAASQVTSSVSEFVESPTATASIGSLVKKLLLRAAGEEGVAERVAMSKADVSAYAPSIPKMEQKMEQKMEKIWERPFETHYRSEWSRVNCIDTTGEAFAIYLNLLYLAPLTWLFGRFFVRAYTARGKGAKPRSASAAAQVAADVAKEARKDTEQSFEKGGMQAEDELMRRGSHGKEKGEELYEQLRKDVKSMKDGTWRDRRVSERVQSFEGKVKTAAEKAKESVKNIATDSQSPSASGGDQQNGGSAIIDDARETAASAIEEKKDSESSEKQAAESPKKQENTTPRKNKKNKKQSGGQTQASKQNESSSGQKISDSTQAEDRAEPADKQEETLAESEPVRPAPEPASQGSQEKESTSDSAANQSKESAPESSSQDKSTTGDSGSAQPAQGEDDEDKLYSEVVAGEGESESAEGGAKQGGAEDDTDAMGRSGVGIESENASNTNTDPSLVEQKAAET